MSATVLPCSESITSGAEHDRAIKRSYCIPIAGHCQLMLKRACATRLAAERGPLDWPLPERLLDTASSVPQMVSLAACPGHLQVGGISACPCVSARCPGCPADRARRGHGAALSTMLVAALPALIPKLIVPRAPSAIDYAQILARR